MHLRLSRIDTAPASGDCLVWAAELGHERVGGAVVHLRLDPALPWVLDDDTILFQSGENAYLEHLFVAEAHRRQGIARALLQAVEAAVGAHGKRHLWLHTGEDNTGAQRFYRQEGWQHVKTVTPLWHPESPMRVYHKEVYSPV